MNSFRTIASSLARPWLWFTRPLEIEHMHVNPYVEFARWYRMAARCIWLEFPDAVCLSTIDEHQIPDARVVLLKGYDTSGFRFYTNYNSIKSRQLDASARAAMTFYWDALQRQVRLKGAVEKLSSQESDNYFQTRPRESQLGAWASLQSEILVDKSEFKRRLIEFTNKFKGVEVPRPGHWGGLRLIPESFEFWKAGNYRLHDRIRYQKTSEGGWEKLRLYP